MRVPSLVRRLRGVASEQPDARQLLRRVIVGATILSLAPASACDQPRVGSLPPPHYADSAVGMARLMRDATPRITRVVDVSADFADEIAVEGAVVLIDDQVGRRLPEDDVRRRPVLVRYVSAEAARQAALEDSSGPTELRARDVLFLPRHFPTKAEKDYRQAMYVGFQ